MLQYFGWKVATSWGSLALTPFSSLWLVLGAFGPVLLCNFPSFLFPVWFRLRRVRMYQIALRRQAYKDLEAIPADYARLISKHIDLLEENPRSTDAKKLKSDAGYSLRVGTYRVLYDIDDKEKSVTIYRIKHRREAYR